MLSKAKKLDRILSNCIKSIEEEDWTIEECLTRYAPYRSELEPMLRTALKLRMARELYPSGTFRSSAQSHLHARILASRRSPRLKSGDRRQVGISPHKPGRTRGIRSLGWALPILLVSFIVAGAGGVLAYSADHAKPGDLLYNLDRTIERIRIQYEDDSQQVVRLHLQFAGERLEEITELLEEGDTTELAPALENYKEQIVATTPLISNAYAAGEDLSPLIEETTSTLMDHEEELEDFIGNVPLDVEAAIRVTIKDIKDVQIFMTSPIQTDQPMAKVTSLPTEVNVEGYSLSTPMSSSNATSVPEAVPHDGGENTPESTSKPGVSASPWATPTPTLFIYASPTATRTSSITRTPTPTPTPTQTPVPGSTRDEAADK